MMNVNDSHTLIHESNRSRVFFVPENEYHQPVAVKVLKPDAKLSGTPEMLSGDLHYIAPEQTGRMNRIVDYRSDLYSLGVVYYEMLTGLLPFESDDPLALVHAHMAKIPEFNFYLHSKYEGQNPKVEKHFKRVDEQVSQCDSIVEEFLEYTRSRGLIVQKASLAPLMESVVEQRNTERRETVSSLFLRARFFCLVKIGKHVMTIFSKHRKRALIALLILSALAAGCQREQPPIEIGFVSNLTVDKTAPLAIGARNGALLAVEDINARGGIHGRKVDLIVKDDRFDPETAVKVDEELIRENVAAIVGHFHSNISLAVLPMINQAKVVMVSPSSASNRLSGIDDYFFKICPPTVDTSTLTATYAHSNGINKMMVLYDLVASYYTEPKFQEFKAAFEAIGGQVEAVTYKSRTGISFPDLAAKLAASDPDGYFIIASHYDTAMVCQHLRKIDAVRPIFISPWAYHQDLIRNGGTAVEGVIMAHSFQKESRDPAFLAFRDNYFKRYKTIPGMWEAYGYEAVTVISQALSENPAPEKLKETLLKIGRFKGLQGDVRFDRNGDNRRKPMLLTIKNGAFVEIK